MAACEYTTAPNLVWVPEIDPSFTVGLAGVTSVLCSGVIMAQSAGWGLETSTKGTQSAHCV